jgi:tetratricopeptide (TPR) repeat protein
MNEWWGDNDRRARAASMADTFYRAGSRDGSVLPALASLALDRSQGLLARASAAEYIGRLISESRVAPAPRTTQTQTSFDDRSTNVPRSFDAGSKAVHVTPAIVNALIGVASDPEPIVRAAAVKALGTTGDRNRVLTPVVARLVDPSRVVRARAVEVLVSFGIVELPGQAGVALKKAQEDYILSLDSFPDAASSHAAKGWLEAELGHAVEARAALDNAITVDPKYAFPYVVKGVLSAREGKFSEAVELWQKARSIEPSYPNINQLISEAEKRKVKVIPF